MASEEASLSRCSKVQTTFGFAPSPAGKLALVLGALVAALCSYFAAVFIDRAQTAQASLSLSRLTVASLLRLRDHHPNEPGRRRDNASDRDFRSQFEGTFKLACGQLQDVLQQLLQRTASLVRVSSEKHAFQPGGADDFGDFQVRCRAAQPSDRAKLRALSVIPLTR